MPSTGANVFTALYSREHGGRRPGTATGQSRRLYQCVCPSSKVQQLDVPEVHICRFSPCGQYLVCFAGGFTQLVVYRFTGPRVSWQGELEEAELLGMLSSFGSFFRLLYRVNVAPAGEVLARDLALFPGGAAAGAGSGGGLLLLASHSPFASTPGQRPPPPDGDMLAALPAAQSIQFHVIRLCDGVRLGGSSLEGELVDLGSRPGSLGVCVHEDLVVVLALRSQQVHLLQLLRGGEELVPVRCLGPHVREDDELVLRTAEEAEERWRRARRAGREAAGRAAPAGTCTEDATRGQHCSASTSAATPAHPATMLYPPPHRGGGPRDAATLPAAAAGGNIGVAPVDLAAAAAHQASIRQHMRQRQYEQLAAQAGPGPPPNLRGVGAPIGWTGGAPSAHVPVQGALGPHGALPPEGAFPDTAAAAGMALPVQASLPVQHGGLHRLPHHHVAPPYPPPRLPASAAAAAAAGRAGGRGAADGGDDESDDEGGGGGCVTGLKQRLLAHLYGSCVRAHPRNPRRLQREAMALFRSIRMYQSLIMRKVYLLDRNRLLIDLRTPAGADLGAPPPGGRPEALPGGGQGLPPSQFFMLFDLHTTEVLGFKASPGDKLIEAYVREASITQPWAEPLPAWDRFTFENALSDARGRLRHPGSASPDAGGQDAAAAASQAEPSAAPGEQRASAARKLMQLVPPVSGSCRLSSSPYLDASLFTYDDRVISPYLGVRTCSEQPISFRPRNRPDWVGFRLEPGPYQPPIARGRRLGRSVTHLFHPDAPFVMAVFSVFQQNSLNINFRT